MSYQGAVRASKRRTVCERDGGVCHYCGIEVPINKGTTDHIVAQTVGGTDANWNLVWSCKPCNNAKGDEPPTCGCPSCADAYERWKHGEVSTKRRTKSGATGHLTHSLGAALADAGLDPSSP